jgi:SOS response regulatory protein OraA/RecX
MKTTDEEAKQIEQKMENSSTWQQMTDILMRFLLRKGYSLEQIIRTLSESYKREREKRFPN